MSQLARLGLEFIPLVVFFVTNALSDLVTATAVFVGVTAVSLVLYRLWYGTVPVVLLIGAVFVGVFGGLTVALGDEIFIKIRPTVVNVFLAALLFGGLATGRLFLKVALRTSLSLDDEGWRLLTWRFAFFFLFLAGMNELVWRLFDNDVWVAYKVWGVMPLSLVFTAFQMPLFNRHRLPDQAGETA
ncbi:septation protein IspZ [Phaeovibrio sulfidiphilus]|uniref:Inner membrane-spanning protein YciB n=1 Tax=Phaeovibrio sulfidiphilus TaxID=1220600 RepID=A0A8J7CCV0_9PROT|nr:inner membrane-spanning protein YciB [Phaeovibrio sulfidiphilus]MBE1236184.1 septation protein IspZ [Phaeovibrio sulfidiphilus]